uniref:Calneuron 1 n=3 Tax=Pipidae TaxID=8352 RepID=A0A803JLJ3_XENTR
MLSCIPLTLKFLMGSQLRLSPDDGSMQIMFMQAKLHHGILQHHYCASQTFLWFFSRKLKVCHAISGCELEKMPFHHVTAGLLYKGNNYLNRSLSTGSDSEQLANISVEELDEIREAFRVLDRDGNGFISKQELGMAMRSLGYMPSEVELAIIMQRLDMDGDGQVDFDEFVTILGPKLVSTEGRDGFLGNTIDSIFWQFDMQRITLEELKHILYHAFRDHLTMKDIENIIINEEESLNENSGNCQTEFEGVHSQKQNRQTCVRKSLICAFAMAFIISVMLIAANQILRSGME